MSAALMLRSSGNFAPPRALLAAMDASYLQWREELETFCSALGARCHLEHVPDERWRQWFDRGEDAEGAVLRELVEVAD